jgi:fatty-acyl-CoA synthase
MNIDYTILSPKSPTPIAPSSRTIPALIAEMALRYPYREALVDGYQRLSYVELAKAVEAMAASLLRHGIAKGDKVAILMGNRVEWIVADFAICSIGAIMVGVNTWVTCRELAYVLSHSEARLLITTGQFLKQDYRQMLAQITIAGDPLPALKGLLLVGQMAGLNEWAWSDWLQAPSVNEIVALAEAKRHVAPSDDAYILYTSGSTANPKGVVLQHYALIENMWQIGQRQHVTEQDRLWLAVSLFWGLGCENALFNLFTHGGCIVLQEHFDPLQALDLIESERCTLFYGTPNMAEALLNHPHFQVAKIKSMRGGATIGTPLQIQRLVDVGLSDICNIYGLTETYGNCAVTDANDPLELRLNSVGQPLQGVQARIVDPATESECQVGEIGEIRVKGYVMREYLKDPERTREAFDEHGFFKTGDLGLINETGHIFFRGRIKEMIKSGGMNVSPVEVEETLMRRPEVLAAYCVPLVTDDFDEVFGAILVPRGDMHIDLDVIRNHCKCELSRYKRPQSFLVVPEMDLPLTNTGKVKKNEMQAWFANVKP